MPPSVARFTRDDQQRFSPKFEQLSRILNSSSRTLQFDSQPDMLAPERLLVFEVKSSIDAFINAAKRVEGLEFIDEEELEGDAEDGNPCLYLLIPDLRALGQIHSLWMRWISGESLPRNYGKWAQLFSTLTDLRPWGPQDRIHKTEISFLTELISHYEDEDLITIEIELVYRRDLQKSIEVEAKVAEFITNSGGKVISKCRIDEIFYHALLVNIKVSEIKNIIELSPEGILGLDPVMYVRPQSCATSIEAEATDPSSIVEEVQVSNKAPILALLDGVPVANHPQLNGRLDVLDEFDLEASTPVTDRVHGTSMASLVLHGDLSLANQPITRKIIHIPVLGANDEFPQNRLIIDVIYQAINALRSPENDSCKKILIVNLSLGNSRKIFDGLMSPWARLLDGLAYKFGLLFVVSAGNHSNHITLSEVNTFSEFEDALPAERAKILIKSLGKIAPTRRLLSPAESINSLTVGAANITNTNMANIRIGAYQINPYEGLAICNASSALGAGYRGGTKPDFLMPGGCEFVTQQSSGNGVVKVRSATQFGLGGIRVAAPPVQVGINAHNLVGGTSVSAALTSRTCHLIYESLESAYGDEFSDLSEHKKAVILKALISHAAEWPNSSSLIKEAMGPFDSSRHGEQRDNIRKFLGYGLVDEKRAVTSADDRVTFWANAALLPGQECLFEVPIPFCMNGVANHHAVRATVAWIAPVNPGKKSYRAVRLNLLDLGEAQGLRVESARTQPNVNQSKKGTIISRIWEGSRAPIVDNDDFFTLTVQRENDQGAQIDEAVEFGLAVTVEMAGLIDIFNEISTRVNLPVQVRV